MTTKIISFYSFRDGTGKSTVVANLAAAIASPNPGIAQKRKSNRASTKVGIVDTNLASPGLHLHYYFPIRDNASYINNYLSKTSLPKEDILNQIVKNYPLNKLVNEIEIKDVNEKDKIYCILANPNINNIVDSLRQPLNYERLCHGLKRFGDKYKLDYLLIDSPSGVKHENLLITSISDVMIIVLRPDKQDCEETRRLIEIAKKIGINKIFLIMNNINSVDKANENELDDLRTNLHIYFRRQASLIGILPHSEAMVQFSMPETLKSFFEPNNEQNNEQNDSKLFYFTHPEDEWTKEIKKIANELTKLRFRDAS